MMALSDWPSRLEFWTAPTYNTPSTPQPNSISMPCDICHHLIEYLRDVRKVENARVT